jgi:hypothetical protein
MAKAGRPKQLGYDAMCIVTNGLGYLELAKESAANPAEVFKYVEKALPFVERAKQIIDEFYLQHLCRDDRGEIQ